MLSKLKAVPAIIAAAGMVICVYGQSVRYQAQSAALSNGAVVRTHASATGGSYVRMEDGNITFTVNAPSAGFYAIEARYSNTYGGPKTQYLYINNSRESEIPFPSTGTVEPTFAVLLIAGKVNLRAGSNTVAIRNYWGWVDIDYIDVTPFAETPFNLKTTLVNPNATVPAQKMFQFLREQFGKRIISGIMTDYGLGTSSTIETTPVMAHVKNASGKFPAHVGFDFFHGTGQTWARGNWFDQYNDATIRMAIELYERGGFPTFCWHWKDPMHQGQGTGSALDQLFYVRSTGYPNGTLFDLRTAFTNSTYDHWNTSGEVYRALIRDIDMVSDYLKQLQDAGVPILWRPLHEAAGGWFWWGRDRVAKPCAQLWRLMYDRMVNHHGLNNLIWIWTTEQSGPDKNDGGWYPGDSYVDIIGVDIYVARNNYSALSSRFEAIKNMFGTDKIIALSENGSIPHPDSLIATGAAWSWWKTWNGEFMTQHNTTAHWNTVMNHPYVITLEDMPGLLGGSWANYRLNTTSVFNDGVKTVSGSAVRAPQALARGKTLRVTSFDNSDLRIRMVNVQGRTVKSFSTKGSADFSLKNVPAGRYVVEIKKSGKRVSASSVIVK
ncbi:MAG: T9SS type A sorting domain-containing protein [Chitinispirillia bacterium]|nr:T9SS type A sorting domain-containing protein [Chitinispirillia bacterium]